jgi:hypothetical protein
MPFVKEILNLLSKAAASVMRPGSSVMEGIYNRELGIDASAGEDNLLTYCRLSGTR